MLDSWNNSFVSKKLSKFTNYFPCKFISLKKLTVAAPSVTKLRRFLYLIASNWASCSRLSWQHVDVSCLKMLPLHGFI